MSEEFDNNQDMTGTEESGKDAVSEQNFAEHTETAENQNLQDSAETMSRDQVPSQNTTYSWVNPKISGNYQNTDNSASFTGRDYTSGQRGYTQNMNYSNATHSENRTAYTSTGNPNTADYGSPAGRNTAGYGNPTGQNTAGYGNSAGQENTGSSQAMNSSGSSYGSYNYNNPDPDSNPEPSAKKTKKKKEKKPMTTGKKWSATIAMAVCFGLVAGIVFTGTSYVGSKLVKQETKQEITIPETVSSAETSGDSETAPVVSENTSSDMTVEQVSENCMASVVAITTVTVSEVQTFFGTQSQETPASGTGVIVGKNDTELLIATNNHVVSGATQLSVVFNDETTVEGQIKGTDSENDLAVVAVKLEDIPDETLGGLKIATMGNSDDLKVGQQVVAIGNALGIGQSVTSGYVSALDRSISSTDETTGEETTSEGLIQTDAAINPGNSGGALLNMKGELVGINEAKYSSTSVEGMGFAIPISKAEPILENLMNLTTRYKVSDDQASYIGIQMADVSSSVSQAYGIPTGVCIMSVMEGSPAEAAGLKKGDVITAFDGREVSDATSLKEILQYYPAGETVIITVQRADNGEYVEQNIEITLGSADDMPETSSDSEESQGSNQNGQSNQNGGFFGNP